MAKNTQSEKKTTEKTETKTPKVLSAARGTGVKFGTAGVSHFQGFMTFVREQGVVGLAVGLAIGAAAGAAVKQIVDGFINPIVGFLIGGVNLVKLKWVVVGPNAEGVGGLVLGWGGVLSAIITLIATALVVYWLIRVAKLDKLDIKK